MLHVLLYVLHLLPILLPWVIAVAVVAEAM